MRKLNTQDVFKMARFIKKADLKEIIKDLFNNSQINDNRSKDIKQKELGVNLTLSVIEKLASEEMENEFYVLIAGVAEKSTEDIKNMTLESLIEIFMQIKDENNIEVFSKAVLQSVEKSTK